MLVTIWVCLLFFAAFEQRRDHLQQRISHTFQVSPELIQPISTQLGLKPQTLLSLRHPIQLKYTTLKQIDTLLTQLRKDA
ncbi:hypothetical protein KAR63_00620 [Weissella uvarum]|nr:hypothetical protein [Weissella uvarum]